MEGRFGNLEGRVGSLEAGQRETNLRLSKLEETVKNIDSRLEAIENDVKEIYLMLTKNKIKLCRLRVLKAKS